MDQSVLLVLDQPGAADLEVSGTQSCVFRNILNNRALQQPETDFPTLCFSGDNLSRNNCVTFSMCACAYSSSELVKICYVFCFDVNLNLFI